MVESWKRYRWEEKQGWLGKEICFLDKISKLVSVTYVFTCVSCKTLAEEQFLRDLERKTCFGAQITEVAA